MTTLRQTSQIPGKSSRAPIVRAGTRPGAGRGTGGGPSREAGGAAGAPAGRSGESAGGELIGGSAPPRPAGARAARDPGPEEWLGGQSGSEPLRRLPSQQRSRQRVERILDAAGDLVAERGYEGTTTSLIARRAHVSPGSFYQFFADKRAAVQALSARNLAVFAERLDASVVAGQFTHWWDGVEAAFDIYVDLCRHHSGFRAVRFGDIVDTHLLDPEQDNDSVVSSRIAAMLTARFDVVDTPAFRLALLTTIKVADALIRFAFARDSRGDEEVLTQARRLLRAHLESYVQTR